MKGNKKAALRLLFYCRKAVLIRMKFTDPIFPFFSKIRWNIQ